MDVALISDSHIPSREHEIPPSFRERIEVADHVIHAGDFDSKGALADSQHMAAELTAVSGNIDPQIGLPERATVELGGVTFVVTHGTGSQQGWADRVAAAVREEADSTAVGVAGHTHELVDTVYEGVRLLNPGSVTGASPADRPTMLTATVEDGTLDVAEHEL
ncbi:YfcE family phosphodiesterase [Haloarcula taiwanensis]|uniref:Phosphoesterase n=1 Tax=Haloarcula taiwanensis TaxID=1932004 RepID=A0A2H5A1G4_9EURY|nr:MULTISPECIES: metallophosphoesterase family protein [Haloarcula]AUG48573.1 YfcE family phosphodiesterase [Haloarcula taiwanensis]RLM39903.1 metallophosphoesterase [Haloarcula sp. Atlit-120R]RLM47913.1 metallophosphoesterase [Haloarcula sp. Atlit-47R]RLM96315.1 metallophosphoesterase [Haloarcula sp. Atlit-7R]